MSTLKKTLNIPLVKSQLNRVLPKWFISTDEIDRYFKLSNITPKDGLLKPVNTLYGVTDQAAELLKSQFKISNVFDLACAKIFADAKLLSELGKDEISKYMQLGTLLSGIVDDNVLQNTSLKDLKNKILKFYLILTIKILPN